MIDERHTCALGFLADDFRGSTLGADKQDFAILLS